MVARVEQRIQLFTKSARTFVTTLRRHAAMAGFIDSERLGSHSFRRGMARDIIDAGGSLAALLQAGQWRSSAFALYLRENQCEESAIANMIIDHSDSE